MWELPARSRDSMVQGSTALAWNGMEASPGKKTRQIGTGGIRKEELERCGGRHACHRKVGFVAREGGGESCLYVFLVNNIVMLTFRCLRRSKTPKKALDPTDGFP